jgi:hypothetical protein
MTCPFRIAPEHGCREASGLCSDGLLACIRQRERDGRWALLLPVLGRVHCPHVAVTGQTKEQRLLRVQALPKERLCADGLPVT